MAVALASICRAITAFPSRNYYARTANQRTKALSLVGAVFSVDSIVRAHASPMGEAEQWMTAELEIALDDDYHRYTRYFHDQCADAVN